MEPARALGAAQDLLWEAPGAAIRSDVTWLANPYRGWAERYPTYRACGYLCSNVPIEVVHAAGLCPVRLLSLGVPVAKALGFLPAFCCALAQGTTERMLSGEMAFLEWVVTAHSCDTLKCLHDIWHMALPGIRLLNLSLPVVVGSAASEALLRKEIGRLSNILGSETRLQRDEARLRRSIVLYNQQRRLVTSLYDLAGVPYARRWALALAGLVMPVEQHLPLLAEELSQRASLPRSEQTGIRVVVTGTAMDDASIPTMLDELGFAVVGDDLCTGQRPYAGAVDEQRDPVDSLVEHYGRRSACPGRYDAQHPRSERLVGWAQSRGAQGVVLVQPKFCDPCAFDDVQVTLQLRRAGLPYVVLETDVAVPAGQLRTRLQAFGEMLQAARSDGE